MTEPAAPFEPLAMPQLPAWVPAVQEMERRGLQPPSHMSALLGEMRQRGLVGQQAGSPEGFELDPDAQRRRASFRFQQIASADQPGPEDRQAYIDKQYGQWLKKIEGAYAQSARAEDENVARTSAPERAFQTFVDEPLDRIMGPEGFGLVGERQQLTGLQRSRLYESIAGKPTDDALEQFGQEFDQLNTPESVFVRQRDEAADWLLESYRSGHPEGTDQDAYRHVHRELARMGYQPPAAGQLDSIVDPERAKVQPNDGVQLSSIPYAGDFVAGVARSPIEALGQTAGFSAALTASAMGALGFEEAQFGAMGVAEAFGEGTTRFGRDIGLGRDRDASLGESIAGDLGQLAGDIATIWFTRGKGAQNIAATANRLKAMRQSGLLAGSLYFGLKQAGDTQHQVSQALIAKGVDPRQANDIGVLTGAASGLVNAVLERIPLQNYLNPGKRGLLQRVLRSAVAEGSTESAQELAAVLLEMGADANDASLWENMGRVVYAGTVGALGGGPLGGLAGTSGKAALWAEEQEQRLMEAAGGGNRLAGVLLQMDDAFRLTAQKANAVLSRPIFRGRDRSVPVATDEQTAPTEDVRTTEGPPAPVQRARQDPKIIATPEQMGSWYARTFDDDPNAAVISAMAQQAGERFRLVDVPIQAVASLSSATGDIDQAKASSIAGLNAQEAADLAPIITIPGTGEAALDVIDGNHRLTGRKAAGDATIKAYVPESIAKQIEEGTLPAGPVTAGEAETPDTEGLGTETTTGAEDAGGQAVEPGGQAGRATGVNLEQMGRAMQAASEKQGEGVEILARQGGKLYHLQDGEPVEVGLEAEFDQVAGAMTNAGRRVAVLRPVDTAPEDAGEGVTRGEEAESGRPDTSSQEGGESEAAGRPTGPRQIIEEAEGLLDRIREEAEQLTREANTNPLTGGLNRRSFDKMLGLAQKEADTSGRPFGLIAFDAANLKAVNDTRGDEAGDTYLKRVMKAINDAIRTDGKRLSDAFHYGGDEFSVIVRDLPPAEAEEAARSIMARAEHNLGTEKIAEGVSAFLVGEVGVYEPGSGDVDGLMARTTDAMKARKKDMKRAAGEAVTREEAEQRTGQGEDKPPTVTTENRQTAEQLRKLADGMGPQDAGTRKGRIVAVLRALADANDQGNVPTLLAGVTSKTQVMDLLTGPAGEVRGRISSGESLLRALEGRPGTEEPASMVQRWIDAAKTEGGSVAAMSDDVIAAVESLSKITRESDIPAAKQALRSLKAEMAQGLRMQKAGIPPEQFGEAKAQLKNLIDPLERPITPTTEQTSEQVQTTEGEGQEGTEDPAPPRTTEEGEAPDTTEAAIAEEEAGLKPVDLPAGNDDMRVWWTDDTYMASAPKEGLASTRQAIIDKLEKFGKRKEPKYKPLTSGSRRPRKAPKPPTPARATSPAALATRLLKFTNDKQLGINQVKEQSPSRAVFFNGWGAIVVDNPAGHGIPMGRFKSLDTISDDLAAKIGEYAQGGEELGTQDAATLVRHLRQTAIMASDEYSGALMVKNPDGTLGFAKYAPQVGTAEVNVQDGYTELQTLLDPALGVKAVEMLYAAGAETISMRVSTQGTTGTGAHSYVFTATLPAGGNMTVLVAGMNEEKGVRERHRGAVGFQPPAPEQGQDVDGGDVLASPMADLSFDPATGGTTPGGKPAAAGDPVANTGAFTNDHNPLDADEGRFKRTKRDKPKRVKTSMRMARARARRDGEESLQTDNIYRIVSDLARRFNLGPPGVGRATMLRRWAAGFYRPSSESIRLRRGSYASTFAHEVGHHLHKVMFPRSQKGGKGRLSHKDFPKAWRTDLVKLGRDLYGDRRPTAGYTAEGWAEAVRFLITNPRHFKAQTPNLYRSIVETLITHHPETWITLQDARVRLLNAMNIARVDPVDQYIDHDGGWGTFNRHNAYDWFRTRVTDRFARLSTMKKDLGLDTLPAHLDPHTMALRANGHISGDIKLLMDRGPWDVNDPAKKPTGPGLTAILEPVKHDLRQWQNYMVARRTVEKRAQGFDVLPQDARLEDMTSNAKLTAFIQRSEEVHPEWGDFFRQRGPVEVETVDTEDGGTEERAVKTEDPATVAARFRDFNRWLVGDYAVGAGLISSEQAALIIDKNLEYITFRHKKVEDALSRKHGLRSSGSGFTGQTSGIRRFREGMGEQLYPPLESFFASMQGIVSRANRNKVGRSVVETCDKGIDGAGRWIDKIDRPAEAMKISVQQLSSEIQKQLGIGIGKDGELSLPPWMEDLTEDQLGQFIQAVQGLTGATFWKPGNRVDRDNREVTVLVNGKPQFYEVKDSQLFDLLEGLNNPVTTHLLIRLLGTPGRVLRAGATQLNPSFFVPNFVRDMFQAVTMTETELRKLPQQTQLRVRGMKEAFLGGEYHDLFLASGADMSGIFHEFYDARTQKIDFEAMFEKPKFKGLIRGGNAKQIATDLLKLGTVQRLNQSFELAVRMGEFAVAYEQKKAAGAGQAEAIATAGQQAADITLDFQRGGTWSKQVNEVVPFFNAAILGTDKLSRFIKGNPTKALGRVFATLIVPSLIEILLQADNEDYWAKPKRMRDRYWYFPTGHTDDGRPTYLKLPKPYGLGSFAIVTERMAARMIGIDPETGERGDPRALEGTIQALIGELRPTMNIAGLQPLLEVTAGDQGYSYYRDSEIVSDGDKDLPLGEQGATRSSELARLMGGWMDYPPAKIDYLIQGWFGGLGRDAVQIGVDPVIRTLDPGADEGEPMEFNDWLIIRRFLASETRGGHEAVTRFYDDYEHLKRVKRGLTSRDGDSARYDAYQAAHEAELDLLPIYQSAYTNMSGSFKELRSLYRQRTDIDPDDLDRQVTELYDQIISRAREAHTERRMIAEEGQ